MRKSGAIIMNERTVFFIFSRFGLTQSKWSIRQMTRCSISKEEHKDSEFEGDSQEDKRIENKEYGIMNMEF